MVDNLNLTRVGECNRCGQCCGADNLGAWAEAWPEELFGYTQEQLETTHPIAALCGVPRSDHLSGEVEIDRKAYLYYWHRGLRKSLENAECPFLVYEKDTELYACGLYGGSLHKMWEKNCKIFPAPIMSSPDSENHKTMYPKCSYRWIPEEDIANQIK